MNQTIIIHLVEAPHKDCWGGGIIILLVVYEIIHIKFIFEEEVLILLRFSRKKKEREGENMRKRRKHEMLPPPPRKRKKEIVLEEDEYMERLGSIIERDFFPDLRTSSKRGDENHTVDSFVATHTTEDNRSFEKLQEKSLKEHKEKFWWAYEEKGDSKYRARNHLMFPPSLKQSCEISRVDVKRIKNKSTLLSLKDADDIDESDRKLALQRIKKHAKKRNPKSIVHRNTQLETTQLVSSSSTTELPPPQQKDVWGAGTEGYDYVRTPSIDPNSHGMTPMITWGDVESTPLRVASSDNDEDYIRRKEFTIASQSKRERIHHRLDRKMRGKVRKKNAPSLSSSSSSSRRTRMLSPAAQQLASRVNHRRPNSSSSFKSSLRASYGSSLNICPPRISSSRKRSGSFSSTGSSSATDGLLEL